jgi:predicted kinase
MLNELKRVEQNEITYSPKLLLLMCGPSFSGKTTLSKRIAETIGCKRISFDELNEKRGLICAEFIPPEEWGKTSNEAIDLMKIEMERGSIILIDDTFCFEFLRSRFKSIADEYDYKTLIIFIDISEDTIRNRIKENEFKKVRSTINMSLFDEHMQEFEKPLLDENVIVFHPEKEDMNNWIDNFIVNCKIAKDKKNN